MQTFKTDQLYVHILADMVHSSTCSIHALDRFFQNDKALPHKYRDYMDDFVLPSLEFCQFEINLIMKECHTIQYKTQIAATAVKQRCNMSEFFQIRNVYKKCSIHCLKFASSSCSPGEIL